MTMPSRSIRYGAILILSGAMARPVHGGAPAACLPAAPAVQLNHPNPTGGDEFGTAVAIEGNLAVVGAPNADPGGTNAAGAAYTFDATSGAHLATLSNPGPDSGDLFGSSVAISGNFAIVAARGNDPGGAGDAGSVYVFDATSGSLIVSIDNPEPVSGANYGTAVAILGTTLAVGAPGASDSGVADAGAAWIYDLPAGTLRYRVSNPAPASNGLFGVALDVTTQYLAVGALFQDLAYIFDTATGQLLATHSNPSPSAGDRYGNSVSISGESVAISNFLADSGGMNSSGAVFVFDADTSDTLLASITRPLPGANEQFGSEIALGTDQLTVTFFSQSLKWPGRAGEAKVSPDGGGGSGMVEIRDPATGLLLQSLPNPSLLPTEGYARSMARDGDRVIVGAPFADIGMLSSAGTAWVFSCSDPTPTPTALPTSTPTASPTPACCPGDADNSGGAVNASDFLAVQANFGATHGVGGPGDADCSGGAVNAQDFLAVQASFGSNCD